LFDQPLIGAEGGFIATCRLSGLNHPFASDARVIWLQGASMVRGLGMLWKNGFRFAYGQRFGFPLPRTLRRCLATGAVRYGPLKNGIRTSCPHAVLVAGIVPWFGTNAGGISLQVPGFRLQ